MNILIDPLLFIQFLRESTGGVFNSFFMFCTNFGETSVAIILIAAVYWCLNKKLGEYLFVSQGWADLVNGLAKVTACIYRPWVLDSRVHPLKEIMPGATGYSFPSGHVTTATTYLGGTILRGGFEKPLKIVLAICLALILFSRNYVGVHSVLDVIFGFLFTLCVLLIISKLFDRLEENPNLDIAIGAIGIIIAILVVIYALTKSYPMDYDAAGKLIVDPAILTLDTFRNAGSAIAIFLSWPIERRFIKFSSDGDLETKILRFLCGFIGLEFVMNVIAPALGENPLGAFFQYFSIMIFVMLIYPAIIKYFQNRANAQ